MLDEESPPPSDPLWTLVLPASYVSGQVAFEGYVIGRFIIEVLKGLDRWRTVVYRSALLIQPLALQRVGKQPLWLFLDGVIAVIWRKSLCFSNGGLGIIPVEVHHTSGCIWVTPPLSPKSPGWCWALHLSVPEFSSGGGGVRQFRQPGTRRCVLNDAWKRTQIAWHRGKGEMMVPVTWRHRFYPSSQPYGTKNKEKFTSPPSNNLAPFG